MRATTRNHRKHLRARAELFGDPEELVALLRAQRCLTSRLVTACYGLSANEAHGTCVSAPAVPP